MTAVRNGPFSFMTSAITTGDRYDMRLPMKTPFSFTTYATTCGSR